MESRRDFIKMAGMLAGAGAGGVIPASVLRAFEIEPEPYSTFLDAEHIVVLMQENRSFDHALGTLQGVRGFNDPRAIRQPDGNCAFVQTDAAGKSYAPWRLDIRETKTSWMGYLPHSRESQVDAWNEGHHNEWLEIKRSDKKEYGHIPLTMGYHTREDLPFYYALADAFTVMDQHYCGVMSSTTPNRCAFWTGTIREEQKASSRVFMRNDQISVGNMKWSTWAGRMQDNGISWKYYQNELWSETKMNPEERSWLGNFGDNIHEFFASFNVGAIPGGAAWMQKKLDGAEKKLVELRTQRQGESDPAMLRAIDAKIELFSTRAAAQRDEIARLKNGLSQLDARSQDLHHRAFVTNTGDPAQHALAAIPYTDGNGATATIRVPAGDILHQFRKDVNSGNLPMVSYLAAPEKFSDHPKSHWYGAWYVSEVLDILTKNPEVWKKTIFIVTYDENDGYFDHAPSFVAADPRDPSTGGASSDIDTSLDYTYAEDDVRQGVDPAKARTAPIGMGFRVPMIIASPWTRGGWVNSQLCDHTSNIQFMEHFFEKKLGKRLKESNVSAWRRAISGNLVSAFRAAEDSKPNLDFVDRNRWIERIQQAKDKKAPSDFRALTPEHIRQINANARDPEYFVGQEKGIRPSNALPYELYADGALSPDGAHFELRLTAGVTVHGARSAGAPFNVYLRKTKGGSRARKRAATSPDMLVATYAVKAGDTLPVKIPLSLFADGNYEIDVHGPNGFYRTFAGNAQSPALGVLVEYERRNGGLSGNVQVRVTNRSKTARKVQVIDNAYKTGAKTKRLASRATQTVLVDTSGSHGWYDFTVQVEGSTAIIRFAGRVETGRSSFSDPLMGAVL